MNDQIIAAEVRVVDSEGEMLGVMSTKKAMRLAEEASLDLVEISPQASPPVCKILNYGKFKYENKKRAQEIKKKNKAVVIKEVKFRPNIGAGDFEVKMRNIMRFLADGDKVRVSLQFRGREIVHNDLGMALMQRIIATAGDACKVEVDPKLEGKQMFMVLISNSTSVAAASIVQGSVAEGEDVVIPSDIS